MPAPEAPLPGAPAPNGTLQPAAPAPPDPYAAEVQPSAAPQEGPQSQSMFRATVKPSDDQNPTTPPLPPPLPLPVPADYVSPFQFTNQGSFSERILRGNGLHGGVSAGVNYDDNLFLTNGRNSKVSALSFFLSPFFTLTRGGQDAFEQGSEDSFSIIYGGGISVFDQSHVSPEYNSSISLAASLVFTKVTLGITEDSNIFTDALVGSGHDRTQYRFFNTGLSASIPWTAKTTTSHALSLDVADYQTGYSSFSIESTNSITRPVTEKLSLGVGFSVGATFIQDSPTQPNESFFLSGNYSDLRKLTVAASVGGEVTQLAAASNLSLTYSLTVADSPFDGTSVSVRSYRSVNNSAIASSAGVNNPVTGRFNSDYTATGISLQITQRLLTRFSLIATSGFEYSDYFDATSGSDLNQHYDYFFLGLSLGFPITHFASASLGYNFRENTGRTSSNSGPPGQLNFDDNSFSASVSVHF